MKSWPPASPDSDDFVSAFMHMKENVRGELTKKDMSDADANLAQYMRSSNIGTALHPETKGPYRGQLAVIFETVTGRKINPKQLHVFRPSSYESGVYSVPPDVAHAAVNAVSRKEAAVLADELVGLFYDQYEFSKMAGHSSKQLRKFSPDRYEEQLHLIYDQIRQRALLVIEGK